MPKMRNLQLWEQLVNHPKRRRGWVFCVPKNVMGGRQPKDELTQKITFSKYTNVVTFP